MRSHATFTLRWELIGELSPSRGRSAWTESRSARPLQRIILIFGGIAAETRFVAMSLVLAIVLVLLLFVAGGGYYERSRLKGTGLGSGLAVVLVAAVVAWYALGSGVIF